MKFDVQKSITIDAPMAKVRELVEDFNHWNSWSPWTIVEPGCPIEIHGEPNQPGHSMSWNGQIIGSGNNTIASFDENHIYYNLEFLKPWKSKATVNFLFEQIENQVKVTWSMDSSMPFFMFFMIKTMKNWIGMDYERGLRMLKEVAEQGRVNCETTNNGIVEYQGFSYVGIEKTMAIADMPEAMKKDFEQLEQHIVVNAKKEAKHWVCIYPKFDMKTMVGTYIVAASDENLAELNFDASYVKGNIESSKMLEIKHDGAYDFLGNAWSMGMMFMQAKKLKAKRFPFEEYWNHPKDVTPEALKTSVFFPLKG